MGFRGPKGATGTRRSINRSSAGKALCPDPWTWLTFGIVLTAVGVGWLSTSDDEALWVGWVVLGLGSVLAQVGAVAAGVSIGYRHARSLVDGN